MAPTVAASITKTEATADRVKSEPDTVSDLDQAPLALTDDQLGAIMRLAAPLQPQCRDAFLRILAHELRDKRDVGDGELHRIAAEVIKSYRLFDPPISSAPVGRSRGSKGATG